MTIIKEKDFTLRPLSMDDLDGFFETMQDPNTKKNMNSVPSTLDEAKEEMHKMLKKVKDGLSEIFTIEVDGAYAGNVTLEYQGYEPSDEGRMHLWVHPDFRGRGLGTKALKTVMDYGFKVRKFKKIFAQCKASNIPVVKVNEKLGFKEVKKHVNESGVEKILWVKES